MPRDPEALRRHMHGMWASVASAWGTYADYADTRGTAVTQRMLALTEPRGGERVLELACGAGGVGLAAARLVGPSGLVVLSDVAAEMTAIAAARSQATGLTNVSTAVRDIERIDEPDESYDVVLCREGLMFAFDPALAAAEMRRVLRPGGRLAIAVWGPRPSNPWLGLVFDAVAAQLGTPMPPPGLPGPFGLDDPNRLGDVLRAGGLVAVEVSELPTPLRDDSFESWWTRTSALAGPLAQRLAGMPEEAKKALRARLEEAVRPYRTVDGLEFPGLNLIGTAKR